MIGVDEALEIVLKEAASRGTLPAETIDLSQAGGRVLAQEIRADRDMPPFTRSAMDGYALRSADVERTPASLAVVEEIPAGRPPARTIGPGEASKIMTGAELPDGADAVQMVEKTRPDGRERVAILEGVPAGAHVRRAGEEVARGALLLEPGRVLDAVAIGLLASCGGALVEVVTKPRVAILPTGDELVPIGESPGPSRIRESNGHVLRDLVRQAGGEPRLLQTAPDDEAKLESAIAAALQGADILLLSGGVSMGDYDLVGKALGQLGCRPLFDRVAIQPGKPLFFGRSGKGGAALVFGLPGNPVSAVVDFLVFSRPAIRRLSGRPPVEPTLEAVLEETVERNPNRRGYVPCALMLSAGQLAARPVPTRGSADMVALSKADALAIFPEGVARIDAGARVRVLPLAPLTGRDAAAPAPGRSSPA